MSITPKDSQKQYSKNTHNSQTEVPKLATTEKLRYLFIQLGPSMDNLPIKTVGLQDSGANSCVIDVSVCKAHQCMDQFKFTPAKPSATKISLAQEDSQMDIIGTIDAYFTLTDEKGCQLPFNTKVFVTSGLRHHFYIGCNLLASPYFKCSTTKGLHFTLEFPLAYIPPEKPHTTHFVPFLTDTEAEAYATCKGTCVTTTQVDILPLQTAIINCTLKTGNTSKQPIGQMAIYPVMDERLTSNITVMPAIYDTSNSQTQIIVHNKLPDILHIPADQTIAHFETPFPAAYSATQLTGILSNINVTATNDISFETQNLTLSHNPIQCNEILADSTPQELKDEMETITKQQGMYQIPLTRIYDDAENGDTFEIPNDTKRKNTDPFEQMPTDHLNQAQKELLHSLTDKYRDVFADSMEKIPTTNLVHLHAELADAVDFSKLHTRHTPIPLGERQEVHRILSSMIEAGIIAKAPGQTLLISNLLTRRKKNNTVRILLDARLANSIVRKVQDVGNPTLLESLTSMREAALITVSDLSNAYFQIPTSDYLSRMLAFQAPDNRQLYCLRRCPQGYINSACALGVAVSAMRSLPVLDKELSGVIPRNILPQTKVVETDIPYLQSPIPCQILGAYYEKHSTILRGQPPHTRLKAHQLRRANYVHTPPHCGINAFADDLTIYTTHASKTKTAEHHSSLPYDPDTRNNSPQKEYIPTHKTIATEGCTHCGDDNTSPPDQDDFILHLAQFETLLIRLRKAKMALSPAKTIVAAKKVKLLGIEWSPGRMSISESRITALRNIHITSTKTLHSALASIAYHRMQIPEFSTIAAPLLQIIRTKKFQWTTIEKTAWHKLIDTLKRNSTIHIFDPDKPAILSSDASQTAAAVVLSQECGGKQRLIAAQSRTFLPSERNASILKKEVLAAIYGLKSLEFLIRGCKNLTLEIDSKCLLFLKYCKVSNPYLMRLSILVNQFGIKKIIHSPSACHQPVDAFSRLTDDQRKFKTLVATHQPMTPTEAEILAKNIAIKAGTIFEDTPTANNLTNLLQGPSLPACIRQQKNRPGLPKQPLPLSPKVKHERTVRPPRGLPQSLIRANRKFRLSKTRKQILMQQTAKRKANKEQRDKHNRKTYSLPTIKERKRKSNKKPPTQPSQSTHKPIPTVAIVETRRQARMKQSNQDHTTYPHPIPKTTRKTHTEKPVHDPILLPPPNAKATRQARMKQSTVAVTQKTPRANTNNSVPSRGTTDPTTNRIDEDDWSKLLTKAPPVPPSQADVVYRSTNIGAESRVESPKNDRHTEHNRNTQSNSFCESTIRTPSTDPQKKKDPPNQANMTEHTTIEQIRLNARLIKDGQLSLKHWKQLQLDDNYFGPICQNIKDPKYAKTFIIKDDILFYVGKKGHQLFPKLCLPTVLLSTIIQQNHHSLTMCHTSATTLRKMLARKYFNPQLYPSITQICKNCILCKVTRTTPYRETEFGELPIGSKRQLWYADLTVINPTNSDDSKYLFLAVESLTGYIFCRPLMRKDEASTYAALLQLASTFGATHFKFDGESSVAGLLPRLKAVGLQILFSAVGSSFSNGIAEKKIGQAKELIRALRTADATLTSEEIAALIPLNLNTRTTNDGTITPELFMFRNTLSRNNDLITIEDDVQTHPLFDEHIKQCLAKRKRRNDDQRSKTNLGRRKAVFEKGDLVFCSNRNLISSQKSLKLTHTGPYCIEEIEPGSYTAVLRNIATQAIIKRRLSYLSSAKGDYTQALLNRAWENQLHLPQPNTVESEQYANT